MEELKEMARRQEERKCRIVNFILFFLLVLFNIYLYFL